MSDVEQGEAPRELGDQPNAGDATEVRKRTRDIKEAEKERARQDRAILADIFALQAGRRFIWSILEETGAIGPTTFGTGPNGFPSSELTSYQAGRRDLGLTLFHRWAIEHREGVFAMLDENDPNYMAAIAKRR